MPRVVGLDIGTHAVRAAAVRTGHPGEVVAFGQVGLARGVVEHGEVVDPGAVGAALRRLWRDAHLRQRQVRLGLASLRTIVRQVEMPTMDPAELRRALEFQAADFIPLPPEETYLDFKVVEQFVSPDGEDLSRILIAAIHRETLHNALTAVREAGLQTVAVDLAPFGLVRALGELPFSEVAPGEEMAEAIVSVGAGVTIVVIHEGGVIRFVRIVDAGGADFTVAIEAALGVPFEEAEALKRQLGGSVDRGDEALAAMQPVVGQLVNDVRGSVDFYVAQASARPLSRVLLTGGGALLDGFAQRLADAVGVTTEMGAIAVPVGDIGFLPEQVPGLQPFLPVPVGLALGGDRSARYQVNLLSEREGRVLSPGRLAAAGAAAGMLVLGGLATLTMGRNDTLAAAKDRLELQQATNQQIQATIAGLRGASEIQAEADQLRARVASALAGEVSWSRVLLELARIIPGDVWLDGLQATAGSAAVVSAPPEGAPTATGAGTLTFTATGIDYPAAAAWLQRLSTLASIDSPWVSQMTRGELSFGSQAVDIVTFSSNSTLTDAALTERARRAAAAAGTVASPTTTPTTAPAAGG